MKTSTNSQKTEQTNPWGDYCGVCGTAVRHEASMCPSCHARKVTRGQVSGAGLVLVPLYLLVVLGLFFGALKAAETQAPLLEMAMSGAAIGFFPGLTLWNVAAALGILGAGVATCVFVARRLGRAMFGAMGDPIWHKKL